MSLDIENISESQIIRREERSIVVRCGWTHYIPLPSFFFFLKGKGWVCVTRREIDCEVLEEFFGYSSQHYRLYYRSATDNEVLECELMRLSR